MFIGNCRQRRTCAIVIFSRTLYITIFRCSRNGILVRSKFCRVSSITINPYRARIIGITVAPSYKMVMLVGYSRQRGSCAIVVQTCTLDPTILSRDRNRVLVRSKYSRYSSILYYHKSAQTICTTVAPLSKMVMVVSSSLNSQFVVAGVRKYFCRPFSRRPNGNTILTLFDDIRKRRPTYTILISPFTTTGDIHRNAFRDNPKTIISTLRWRLCFHLYRCKTGATRESTTSNTCYAIRDSNRGKTHATIESIFPNTCYAVGDSD